MTHRDIIVIGASAGGVYALKELIDSIPANIKATFFVVMHTTPYSPSQLPQILSRSGKFQAVHPNDEDDIVPGRIYVAPPDHHLLIEQGNKVGVKKGPKEDRFRPSVDALFRSAAHMYGSRVIGIVLSGALDDGTSGMWAIKRAGGVAIAQDPEEAMYSGMPQSLIENVEVDHVCGISEMGDILMDLTSQKPVKEPDLTKEEMKMMDLEVVIAGGGNAYQLGVMNMGELSMFTCPECKGVLMQLNEGKMIRFRCHTGHAYTASALLASVTTTVEEKLVEAQRALEESTMLLNVIGDHYEQIGNKEYAKKFQRRSEVMAERANGIHEILPNQELFSEDLRFKEK